VFVLLRNWVGGFVPLLSFSERQEMTTARDIITNSLRKIGAVALDEEPASHEAENALTTLNQMLSGFKTQGVDVEHVTLSLNDNVVLDDRWHEGLCYLLSTRLAPDYSQPSFNVSEWWRAFQNSYVTVTDLVIEQALTKMPSQIHRTGQ
jgi:hypothetical protein